MFKPTSTTQSLVSQLKERERAIVSNIASSLHAMLNAPSETAAGTHISSKFNLVYKCVCVCSLFVFVPFERVRVRFFFFHIHINFCILIEFVV